jgi:hypothetical protein
MEKQMKDVTDADDKNSMTKLVFLKVQGRTYPFAKSLGTALLILSI